MENKKIVPFNMAIKTDTFKKLINERLSNKEQATQFIADISSAVQNNFMLQNCDVASVVSSGFVAQALQLSLSPSLGLCYLVPYDCKNGGMRAQFQLGAKGLLQLALRTCAYERIGYKEVREGEYKGLDEFGEPIIEFNEDETKPIVGYYSYFKFNKEHGGLVKKLYWTNERLVKHAKEYSKSYGNGKSTDNWTYRFDDMAKKTVLKQIISKFGIISVEIQKAFEYDQAVVENNGSPNYVDNPHFEPKQIDVQKATVVEKTTDMDVLVDINSVDLSKK